MKFAEEFAMPGTDELKSLETWTHLPEQILKVGRVSHMKPTHLPEEEQEEFEAKQLEEDPVVDRFRALNEDAPMPGLETAWLSKLVGDSQPYNQLPPKEGTTTYAVNMIKSLRWPGAVTCAQNGKFASIYVGYGLKRGDVCFNPTEPPEVQKDPSDQTEQPEPTPLQAPEEPPEPDTDAVKKDEDEEEEA
jgi:radial spoke head protein 4A